MKIAIPCPGLGHVWRGYESFVLDLNDALKNDAHIIIYGAHQVSMATADIRILPTITREGRLAHVLVPRRQRYRVEQVIFSLFLAAWLKREPVDIVHVSDTLVASMLTHLRRLLGLKFRLVFSNGGNRSPELLKHFDLCQILTPIQWESAIAAGVPEENLALVPYGLNCATFASSGTARAEARIRLGLPDQARIILSVGPLGLEKRLDYLIHEIAGMAEKDVVLLIVGQPAHDQATLEREVQRYLPERHRILTLPYHEVPLAYQAADIFALCSLFEGFGRVVLEGMSAGVPTVVHDTPLFQWLVPNDLSRVDMTKPGALAARLHHLLVCGTDREQLSQDNLHNVHSRFDWSHLKAAYMGMYEAALRRPFVRP